MIYNNILETIGRTPVVRLNRIAPQHVEMYVKVEAFNPGGSVKDRLAFAIIADAERRGTLKPGQTVVEATSGNTGIALAMVCAARGHPFVATMVETFSIERRKIMRAFGAKVLLTPAAERGSGMVRRAEELARKHGWFLARQFENPANPAYHRQTTGPEILQDFAGRRLDFWVTGWGTGMVRRAEELARKHGWFLARQFENPANPAYHRQTTGPEILQDFAGRRLDFWVTGWGTGGTLTGAGEVIKAARPEVRVVVTEPAGASLLGGKEWKPHKIQGWTPDFLPDVLNPQVYDELVTVTDDEGKENALRLAREEGIFVGLSAGATLAAGLKVAEKAPAGSSILVMLPDTGERYLSSFLFQEVAEGSDDTWLAGLEGGGKAA